MSTQTDDKESTKIEVDDLAFENNIKRRNTNTYRAAVAQMVMDTFGEHSTNSRGTSTY